jgi:hypothetical protein
MSSRKMQKQLRKRDKKFRKLQDRMRGIEDAQQDRQTVTANPPRPVVLLIERTHIREEWFHTFAVPPEEANTRTQTAQDEDQTTSTDSPVCAQAAG